MLRLSTLFAKVEARMRAKRPGLVKAFTGMRFGEQHAFAAAGQSRRMTPRNSSTSSSSLTRRLTRHTALPRRCGNSRKPTSPNSPRDRWSSPTTGRSPPTGTGSSRTARPGRSACLHAPGSQPASGPGTHLGHPAVPLPRPRSSPVLFPPGVRRPRRRHPCTVAIACWRDRTTCSACTSGGCRGFRWQRRTAGLCAGCRVKVDHVTSVNAAGGSVERFRAQGKQQPRRRRCARVVPVRRTGMRGAGACPWCSLPA